MHRFVLALAAAASLAVPTSAGAADTTTAVAGPPPFVQCAVDTAKRVPGFAVWYVNYTLDQGEPPPLYGPFFPC